MGKEFSMKKFYYNFNFNPFETNFSIFYILHSTLAARLAHFNL